MAARSILQFFPDMGRPFGSAFPEFQPNPDGYDRGILAFDDSQDESWVWTFIAPVGITTPLTGFLKYRMASAVTGTVAWSIAIEAIADGDHDLDAGSYFDAENLFTADTVPGTLGSHKTASKTLTNPDSIQAGMLCRLRLTRDYDQGSASGDAEFLGLEIQDDGG